MRDKIQKVEEKLEMAVLILVCIAMFTFLF
jgi:hypothetical protein